MNIKIQCCGLVVMAILMIIYYRQKKLYLNTEKAFIMELFIAVACLVLDIASVIVLVKSDLLPSLLVDTVCKLYLVSLTYVALFGLLYICTDIYRDRQEFRKQRRKVLVAAVCSTILIMLAPIQGYVKDGVVYTHDTAVNITYVICVVTIFVILIQLYINKSRINPYRRTAVITWMCLWIASALVQLLFPPVLVVGFMGAVGMMVLYIMLENPDMNINRQTGFFNMNALMEYTRQLYAQKQQFSALSMTIETFSSAQEGGLHSNQLCWENLKEVLAEDITATFRKTEDEIVFIFKEHDNVQDWYELLDARLQKAQENSVVKHQAHWVLIPDCSKLNCTEDFLYMLKYLRMSKRDNNDVNYTYVDQTKIDEMYQEKQMEIYLDEAMINNRVEVFYQPIFSVEKKTFVAAEALVRIRDEDGKLIPPVQFIPIAEKNGKIIELGKMVFDEVCKFIKEHHIEQYGLEYIEVNLSVVQCADQKLSDTYIAIMEQHQVPARFINLEITESASLEDKEVLLYNMKNLMNYGVGFSLDDFGTGQSNLNYIVDMPVDIVKFDRSMILSYFDNGKAKYVMDAAMHMIHGMGLQIVSEGIESEHQYKAMEELGICYIQGYYFSKPLPKHEFIQFMQQA